MAKNRRKASSTYEMLDTNMDDVIPHPGASAQTRRKLPSSTVRVIVVAVLLLLGAIWLYRSGNIVAATVNGKPIFRWHLNRALVSRFGQQTLESMITEQLIADAAKKEGIDLTSQEVEAKINEIVKGLGENVNLDELLRYQGMTRDDFEHQIRLQITVEKILSRDIAIEETEVDTFLKENKDTLVATDAALQREEARTALKSQKISEKIQPWLAELKGSAKVTKLLP